MQPHAEHQQHHTQFGQLVGDGLVGHESRRKRPHAHAGQQIADQRRELHLLRERAKNEGDREADGDDVDEAGVVMHSNPL